MAHVLSYYVLKYGTRAVNKDEKRCLDITRIIQGFQLTESTGELIKCKNFDDDALVERQIPHEECFILARKYAKELGDYNMRKIPMFRGQGETLVAWKEEMAKDPKLNWLVRGPAKGDIDSDEEERDEEDDENKDNFSRKVSAKDEDTH